MGSDSGKMKETLKKIGAGVASLGFLVPALGVTAVAALVMSRYAPLEYVAPETAAATSAAPVELAQVDTSEIEKDDAEALGTLAADLSGIDLANVPDGTYTGSGTGFSGVTTVQVTVSGGKITAIEVLSYADDDSYFSRARAVIDSVLASQSVQVDTVSGATYSSNGILMAIKNALISATGGTPEAVDASGAGSASASANKALTIASAVEAPANGYADGEYYGSGDGFNDTITVKVTISGGKIASVEVVSQNDTFDYFTRAWNSISSAVIAAQGTNVDSVSGATYSSEGIKTAINEALRQAAAAAGNKTDEPAADDTNKDTEKPSDPSTPTTPTDPEDPSVDPDNPGGDTTTQTKYEDGEYTGYALCENEEDAEAFNRYYVAVTVVVKDGKVANITDIQGVNTTPRPSLAEVLDPFDEQNTTYLDNAINGRTFRGKVYVGVPEQLLGGTTPANVQVVSRATYSSRAIAKAYEDALAQAAEAYKKAHPDETEGGETPDPTTPTTPTDPDTGETTEPDTGETTTPDTGETTDPATPTEPEGGSIEETGEEGKTEGTEEGKTDEGSVSADQNTGEAEQPAVEESNAAHE